MEKIDSTTSFQIFVSVSLGALFSVMIFFMIEVLYAQVLLDYIIANLDNSNAYFNIFLIFIGGEIIALLISIGVSLLIIGNVKRISIYKAILLAFILNLVLWFAISFLSIFFIFPEVFENIIGYEILVISPILIVYFGVYVLNDITLVWIITQITYFVLFGIFLIVFYKPKKKERQKRYLTYETKSRW